MFMLLRCEWSKFRRSYINSLSLMGIVSPFVLALLMFLVNKDSLLQRNGYTWPSFFSNAQTLLAAMAGPVIISFLAVFAIYFEYQENTMKNILTLPYTRNAILLNKLAYVAVFAMLEYGIAAVVNIAFAWLLGLQITAQMVVQYTSQVLVGGLAALALIPLMFLITLLFKSFLPALVITVCGAISNILVISWDKSYISPWAAPFDIAMIVAGRMDGMKMVYPLITLAVCFTFFLAACLAYFNWADQTA